MKAILITYNQAYYDEIAKVLNDKGHGSNTGEPHYGTHAWPTLNNAIISIVDDDKVDGILNQLHEKDLKTPDLGLRAFSWNIEKMI